MKWATVSNDSEWHRVLDTIHDGMVHGLNGRLAGIDAIVQIARMRGSVEEELMELLTDEALRLKRLTEAATQVPRIHGPPGGYATVDAAVSAASSLQRLRKGIEVELAGGAPAITVRMSPDDINRCLLLVAAALEPVLSGSAAIVVTARISHGMARLVLREATASSPAGNDLSSADPSASPRVDTVAADGGGSLALNTRALSEAQQLVAMHGGTVAVLATEAAVEVLLPAVV